MDDFDVHKNNRLTEYGTSNLYPKFSCAVLKCSGLFLSSRVSVYIFRYQPQICPVILELAFYNSIFTEL
jgi:hypothetical protein